MIDTIIPIIEKLGIPVGCLVALGWFCYTYMKESQATIKEISETHKHEMKDIQDNFTAIISKNTEAVNSMVLVNQKLADKLNFKEEIENAINEANRTDIK